MAQKRHQLLTFNDPSAMRINRELAIEIGLDQSILLLQLEYLISIAAHEHDGRLWTYQSLADLHEIFKWWSPTTISRLLKDLEKAELIVVGNFNKKAYDRTRWYALNPVGIARLHSIAIFQNEKWNTPDQDANFQNEKSIFQNGDMEHAKMKNASRQNETTIPKTSSKSSTKMVEEAPNKSQAQPDPLRTAAAALCGLTGLMSRKQKLDLDALVAELKEQRITTDELEVYRLRWFDPTYNYRARNAAKDTGRKFTGPTPEQVLTTWSELMTAVKPTRQQHYQQPKPAEAEEFLSREALAEKMRAAHNAAGASK